MAPLRSRRRVHAGPSAGYVLGRAPGTCWAERRVRAGPKEVEAAPLVTGPVAGRPVPPRSP